MLYVICDFLFPKVLDSCVHRGAKMKLAHKAAEEEVAKYKAQKEAEFQEYKAKVLSGTGEYDKDLAVKTEAEIRQMQADLEKQSQSVVRLLVDAVKATTA
eukprot:c995_g1_i2.p2 GENE.c995_g1_i2~~c995_g1_i2.p2  ORF type:complete len:100 (+),score=32.18 c995_g1_i2:132-431(+)